MAKLTMRVLKCGRIAEGSNASLGVCGLQNLYRLRTCKTRVSALSTRVRREPLRGYRAAFQPTQVLWDPASPCGLILPHLWYSWTMIDLRSKARQRLLAYYFANPTARLHLRDLAGQLDIDPSNLSKELHRLETEGLFRSEVSGRQKYFQLNRNYPLFAEVRSIVSKTIGAPSLLAQAFKKTEGIEEAYLYGSFASNQQDASSDIDVLVIGAPRGEVLAEAMRKIERQLGREVSYTVLTRKEFDSRRARKDAFLENVWRNKRIPLVGPHEKTQAAHD
jgi:predicted nucleotidyltransferase